MKKILFLLICWIFVNIPSMAQTGSFQTSAYIDGYWSDWESRYVSSWALYGSYDSFCISDADDHPSNFYFRFSIDNYVVPDKKTKRQHWLSKTWYEYTGWVEFNINDSHPTAKDGLRGELFIRNIPYVRKSWGKVTKRVRARIKIASYKKFPQTYNIYYEDVGFAIDLNSNYRFEDWKNYR